MSELEISPADDPVARRWHPDESLLGRYAQRETDVGTSMAVEGHLMECSACRAALTRFVAPERLERSREAVLAAADAPRRGVLERLLIRAGMAETTARLVSATPSLCGSWFAAVSVALGFAVVASHQRGGIGAFLGGIDVFLVVAPLLPVIGVAAAYGPGVDPTYEIGLAAPLSSLRLLLLRVAAVLITTTVLAGLAGLALPGLTWAAVAWLLPALGLTLGTVALSTLIPPMPAARLVGLAWLVVAGIAVNGAFPLSGQGSQLGFALLAAVAGLVIVRRGELLNGGGTA